VVKRTSYKAPHYAVFPFRTRSTENKRAAILRDVLQPFLAQVGAKLQSFKQKTFQLHQKILNGIVMSSFATPPPPRTTSQPNVTNEIPLNTWGKWARHKELKDTLASEHHTVKVYIGRGGKAKHSLDLSGLFHVPATSLMGNIPPVPIT
jgi:hypothetical protein